MKLLYEFASRNIAGEHFLVPIGAAARRYNGMFALSETAAFIWRRLEETQDEGELPRLVHEAFAVDPATAAADTAEFLQALREMELLE